MFSFEKIPTLGFEFWILSCFFDIPLLANFMKFVLLIYPFWLRIVDQVTDIILVITLLPNWEGILMLITILLSTTVRWYVSLREIQTWVDEQGSACDWQHIFVVFYVTQLVFPINYMITFFFRGNIL